MLHEYLSNFWSQHQFHTFPEDQNSSDIDSYILRPVSRYRDGILSIDSTTPNGNCSSNSLSINCEKLNEILLEFRKILVEVLSYTAVPERLLETTLAELTKASFQHVMEEYEHAEQAMDSRVVSGIASVTWKFAFSRASKLLSLVARDPSDKTRKLCEFFRVNPILIATAVGEWLDVATQDEINVKSMELNNIHRPQFLKRIDKRIANGVPFQFNLINNPTTIVGHEIIYRDSDTSHWNRANILGYSSTNKLFDMGWELNNLQGCDVWVNLPGFGFKQISWRTQHSYPFGLVVNPSHITEEQALISSYSSRGRSAIASADFESSIASVTAFDSVVSKVINRKYRVPRIVSASILPIRLISPVRFNNSNPILSPTAVPTQIDINDGQVVKKQCIAEFSPYYWSYKSLSISDLLHLYEEEAKLDCRVTEHAVFRGCSHWIVRSCKYCHGEYALDTEPAVLVCDRCFCPVHQACSSSFLTYQNFVGDENYALGMKATLELKPDFHSLIHGDLHYRFICSDCCLLSEGIAVEVPSGGTNLKHEYFTRFEKSFRSAVICVLVEFAVKGKLFPDGIDFESVADYIYEKWSAIYINSNIVRVASKAASLAKLRNVFDEDPALLQFCNNTLFEYCFRGGNDFNDIKT